MLKTSDKLTTSIVIVLLVIFLLYTNGCTLPNLRNKINGVSTQSYPLLTEEQRQECYQKIIDSDIDKLLVELDQFNRLKVSMQLIGECEK
jgi:hypothetical protein